MSEQNQLKNSEVAQQEVEELKDLTDLMKELIKMFRISTDKQKELKKDIDLYEELNNKVKEALTPSQSCLVSKDFLIEKCIRLEHILTKIHTSITPLIPLHAPTSEEKQKKVQLNQIIQQLKSLKSDLVNDLMIQSEKNKRLQKDISQYKDDVG